MNTLTDNKFKDIFPYDKPRHNQREIIERIIKAYESGKRYVILSAPTGTGKSCIGYSATRYFGSGYILTSQKILQQQYFNDFKIPFVLGKSNYTCEENNSLTCDMCPYMNNPKRKAACQCPYALDRNSCISNNFSNINYSYFLNAVEANMLPKKDIIICDEAHNLESELLKLYTIKLSEKILKFIGCVNIKLPNANESDALKCKWLIVDLKEQISSIFLYLKGQMNNLNAFKSTREYKKIYNKYNIVSKYLTQIMVIKEVIENNINDIVITSEKDEIEYKMLHCNKIFKKSFEEISDKFLFMSATILNYKSFIKDIGLDPKLVEFIECDSTFPVENRLIHYHPVGSMSYKNKASTIPKMIQEIDKILKANKNVKGIIHTVNYDIAEKIIEGLKFSDQSRRLVMPRGADKQTTLNSFYNTTKPLVLISPSLMEGIDLKEDLSRLCIICKIPYANLMDKWTKRRMDESKEWYTNKACTNLVQMTGRSIRSETDFATTYLLDSDFMNLARFSMNVFPKWWQESVIVDD